MKTINLSHILVEHRHEAEDLEIRLGRGEDFADLAKRLSKCASASGGGKLGEVPVQRLDQDFREAAEALQPGQISGPVRTRFGYHLIQRH